ncbi:hypothetical protein [Alistipes sp. ZOR0009]|jgi:hypothetical protein|uniref:hypothetical protein n=1 Tax=Alistipes sp. ZOR0009 TaxID=1339253 RepID=UPI0006460DB3|nr:hypothetical protein [Alistipes sp. ZOR0009]
MSGYKTKDEILQQAGTSITNVEANPVIAQKLTTFGFDEQSLAEGKRLVTDASAKTQRQLREVGEQRNATARSNQLFEVADVRFKVIYKISKLAIKEKGLLAQLGVENLDKTSFHNWAQRRIDFYANALKSPVILERFEKFNIKAADLEAAQKMVEQAVEANQEQIRESGEAHIATSERDDAFGELQRWYSEFRQLAKLALDKHECEIVGF